MTQKAWDSLPAKPTSNSLLEFGNAHTYKLGDKLISHINNTKNYRFCDQYIDKEEPLAGKTRGEKSVGWKKNEIYKGQDRLSK